jgi:DNA-binding beta-propeller fold protein YncE
VSPRGIAAAPDGLAILVADPHAGGSGAIITIPVHCGKPTIVTGSRGTAPQNLVAVSKGGKESIYFTGKDPVTGKLAVLMLPAIGAPVPVVLYSGSPLVSPDGVAVTRAGTLFIADRAAAGQNQGEVFRISNSRIIPIAGKIRLGNPGGIALSPNDALLLVSALQDHYPRAQVVLVDLQTLATGSVTKVVGTNPGAGGLHAQPLLVQGKGPALYSWCGVTVDNRGVVFQVRLS